jgi:hypothetical protein
MTRHFMVAEGPIPARSVWLCSAKNDGKQVFYHVKCQKGVSQRFLARKSPLCMCIFFGHVYASISSLGDDMALPTGYAMSCKQASNKGKEDGCWRTLKTEKASQPSRSVRREENSS